MDGREGMPFHGSVPASYFLNRTGIGGSGGGSGVGPNVHGAARGGPVFKPHSSSNISVQPSVAHSGIALSGSTWNVENQPQNFTHSMSMDVAPSSTQGVEPVKKKRGRPRKYGPDRSNMALGLSPISASTPFSDEMTTSERKRRGRPPGSGWKQQLAPLGEWMNSTAGLAFTPHVILVEAGEDIAAKILTFAQQRPRALCVLSGNGSVSAITLRQPTTSAGTVTYEGRFEILCLSGSYLLDERAGPRNRTGGVSISVCNPDGHMIGGAIGGRLIAANPVQVVACSFIHGSSKAKNKEEFEPKDEKFRAIEPSPATEKPSLSPGNAAPSHPSAGTTVWRPDSRSNAKHSHSGFDLTRG